MMTTDDLRLPHSSGGTRCYRRRQSASASASEAKIVVSRSPSPAPTRAMQRSAPRPAPSRAPRRPSRHPKMQPASRRRRPLSVATGSPAASLSCSTRARAPAVICSTCGSATLPGRCARGPPARPDPPLACKRSPRRQFCSSHASARHGARSRPSHASAHHGARSCPRMQALPTALGPALACKCSPRRSVLPSHASAHHGARSRPRLMGPSIGRGSEFLEAAPQT